MRKNFHNVLIFSNFYDGIPLINLLLLKSKLILNLLLDFNTYFVDIKIKGVGVDNSLFFEVF